MPARSSICASFPAAHLRSPCACRLIPLFVGFALVMSSAGCLTDKQERFEQYSHDGVLLYQRGDYVSAREHFELALMLEPKDTNLLFNLGQCHDRLGQSELA